MHVNPDSTAQLVLQPSPPTVFPSSQASPAATRPSPQIVWQTEGVPMHVNPDSTAQLALQPSPPTVLPSSQASLLARKPSLHTATQVEGAPAQ